MNCKYLFRIIGILIVIVIARCFYSYTSEKYYDYISYLFSIGFLLLILLPNLHKFKFWGIEASSEIDDTENIHFISVEVGKPVE